MTGCNGESSNPFGDTTSDSKYGFEPSVIVNFLFSSGCIDFNPPLQMVLVTNSFQFFFFHKAKDGFGRNEGFQKTKVMDYYRKTKWRLKTKTMQKTPNGSLLKTHRTDFVDESHLTKAKNLNFAFVSRSISK
jgi:hypothetical protein